jgi:FKBP-type peptidyl-prolyl cis-trans isomerase FklB
MNLKSLVIILLASTFVFSSCKKQPAKVKLRSEVDSISYCIGLSIGRNLKDQLNLEKINTRLMAEAIDQIFKKDSVSFNPEKVDLVIRTYLMKLRQVSLIKNLKEGKDFLEKNKSEKNVKVLPDGLQYLVMREGTGPIPIDSDYVKVNYLGTTIDGKKFESSYDNKEPVQFKVNQVIKGWTEALKMMRVGSKWKLFIPTELAYGERAGGNIKPNSVLIFEIELLSIEKAPAAAQRIQPRR